MMINDIINNYNLIIEGKINELLPESNNLYKNVEKAARYSLLLGGKRIRPILMMEFYRLCGGDKKDIENFAVALEMIHTYSLIHDDLPSMDNDQMRRGKPSCHVAFGEDTALLAGDALLTKAFWACTKAAEIAPGSIIKAMEILADCSGIDGMIGGQVIDLESEGKSPDISVIEKMYLLKTGGLIKAAVTMGCVLAGAAQNTIDFAEIYAEKLGLAFQIIDDILDYEGDEALLGKPKGSDLKNEKTTFVSFYGLEKSKELANTITNQAIAALNNIEGDKTAILELTDFLLSRNY